MARYNCKGIMNEAEHGDNPEAARIPRPKCTTPRCTGTNEGLQQVLKSLLSVAAPAFVQ